MSKIQTISAISILGLLLAGIMLTNFMYSTGNQSVNTGPVLELIQEDQAFSQIADQALSAPTLGKEILGIWQWQRAAGKEKMILILQAGGQFQLSSYFSDRRRSQLSEAKGTYSVKGHVLYFDVKQGDHTLFSAQSRLLVESVGGEQLIIRNESNRQIGFQRQALETLPVQL